MKELPPDKHHLQAKMKEWLDANQETYSQFKDKIQSALKESLCGKNCKLSDDEMTAFKVQSWKCWIIRKTEHLAN